jgi:hypothetical protein
MNSDDFFDDISRVVGSDIPRRQVFRLLLGGLAGVTFGTILPRNAAAAGLGCPFVECPDLPGPLSCDGHIRICFPGNNTIWITCEYSGDLDCRAGARVCRVKEIPRVCPGRTVCVDGRCVCSTDDDCPGDLICCNTFCCKAFKKNGTSCQRVGCCTQTASFVPTAIRVGPPAQMDITVQDTEGLDQIICTKLVNVRMDMPSFAPGTTKPVVCTATKINPALPSQVELRTCRPDGCCQNGDPVLAVLRVPAGEKRVRETFADVPTAERFVRIQNGAPGLPRVDILVNGQRVKTFRLGRGEVATADIGPYPANIKNLVTVVGFGQPGHSALLLISDDSGPQDASSTSIALPQVAWDPGSVALDQNLRWGR